MFSYGGATPSSDASDASNAPVWWVADGGKRRATRAPVDAAVEAAVQRLLARDAAYAAKVKRVRRYQARLRGQVSARGWQAYLQLEEVELARWAHALELVGRWGLVRRRRQRGGAR